MDVRQVLALRGPNVWANFPVLEAWVDLGPLQAIAAGEWPVLLDRLAGRLAELAGGPDRPGPLVDLAGLSHPGATLAHVLERVVLALQRLAGGEVAFGCTWATGQPGVYRVACAYEHEDLARAALAAGHALCLASVQPDRPFDAPAEAAQLRELARRLRPAPLAAAATGAARRRGIPVRALPEGLLVLGHGARQQRILGARTGRTSALAESISCDADLTRELLRTAGVPVVPPGASDLPRWRLLVVGGRVAAALALDPPADVTARVHPQAAAWAVEAAEVVGLDVAGVVLVAPDIDRPPEAPGGVAAVEADPPVEEAVAGPVGEAMVADLFPTGQDGRVPVVAITGVNGKTTTTRLIAHILAHAGRCTGMACTEGIYIGGRLIEAGDCSGPRSAQTVLQHPEVEAAVLETARGGILRAGLGYDQCDVAVVTNVGEGDHLGCGGVETVEELARVKRTVVEAVRPGGAAVLNAADPLVAAMAACCRGSVIFFARSAGHPVIVAHRAAGGAAAFVRDGRIVLAEGEREIATASLLQAPLTGGGRVGFQIENALAAVAAAWRLGVEPSTIWAALRSFGSDVEHTPARFNLLAVNGAVAVLDYGHNTSSLVALLETLAQFPAVPRTAVYTAAGDRRDSDLIRQAELLGDAFDHVILYEDGNCARGRKPGEITELFRQGLAGRSRVGTIQEVQGAVRAVAVALSSARPGELLLVQVDVVDETMDLLRDYLSGPAAREIGVEEALAILSGAAVGMKVRRPEKTGSPPDAWPGKSRLGRSGFTAPASGGAHPGQEDPDGSREPVLPASS